jgi:hypothetical protein
VIHHILVLVKAFLPIRHVLVDLRDLLLRVGGALFPLLTGQGLELRWRAKLFPGIGLPLRTLPLGDIWEVLEELLVCAVDDIGL